LLADKNLTNEAADFLKRIGDYEDDEGQANGFNLVEVTNAQLTSPEYRGGSGFNYISEASCHIIDEFGREWLLGKCHRQLWYRKHGYQRTPFTPLSMRRMKYGVFLEDALQDMWKKAGIFVQNNVRLRSHELMVGGEIDAIVFDHEAKHPVGVEVKTGYGYSMNKEVFGRANALYPNGHPKWEHLMQVMMYLHLRKPIENVHGQMPYFLLYYMDRADCRDTQFKITLSGDYEGEPIIHDIYGNLVEPSIAYPIDNRNCELMVEIKPVQNLTIENMLKRYERLKEVVIMDEPPNREFFLRYPDELAQDLFELGILSKTKWGDFQRKKDAKVGDWQCSFCDWQEECYPEGANTDISQELDLLKRVKRISTKA
jgi:CRISPR/Cas system-associated exonuclease Cas4 (RecB family)